MEHTGEYREIDPPHRLSFTWRSDFIYDEDTLVTVMLEAVGDKTDLVLTHELIGNQAAQAMHPDGWNRIMAHLEKYLTTKGVADGD